MEWNLTYIVLGCTLGLMGWLIYWAGLPIIAGLIGALTLGSLGYIASGWAQATFEWSDSVIPFMVGGCAVVGMLLGVTLMKLLQTYVFFIAGASIGGALGWMAAGTPFFVKITAANLALGQFILVGAFAIVFGLITVRLRRYVIALITSFAGALVVGMGLPPEWVFPGTAVALVVVTAVQVGLVHKFVDNDKFDDRMRNEVRKAVEKEQARKAAVKEG
jgi:hypothetical protein